MHDRHAWHQMADLLSDAVLNAMWWLYGGLIAFGSCWWMGYGGYRAWQEWDRDRLQRREERRAHRLEDDVAGSAAGDVARFQCAQLLFKRLDVRPGDGGVAPEVRLPGDHEP